MKIIKPYIKFINENLNESRSEFLAWKRKNVTIRGMKEVGKYNNGGAMLGDGLYTAALSNKDLAKKYGNVYFVVNAKPKHPKIFNTLNDWEIWEYNTMIYNYCREHDVEPSKRTFLEMTSIKDELMKLGYDGVVIKGREIVNFTPGDDVMYFKTESELENYYNYVVINQ
jgi:pentatricopeptide repeat protein